MKLRISDRILVALAGLVLLAGCAGIIAQVFFQADLAGAASRSLANQSFPVRAGLIVGLLLLLALGVYCVLVLFRHRGKKERFVMQKNDNGELSISVKALESMVSKCLEPHPEVRVESMDLENQKDGLLIRLNGTVAGGISIPLTVEALQRQIKQYVTACSGVEIKGIVVEIDSSGDEVSGAPFAIDAPAAKPLLKEENAREEAPATPATPATPVTSVAAEAPAEEEKPRPAPMPIEEDDDDRPLHQRLFKSQPEPCIVPEPPVNPEENAAAEAPVSEEAPSYSAAEEEGSEEPAGEEGSGAEGEAPEAVSAGAENTLPEDGEKAREAFEASQSVFDRIVTGQAAGEEKKE